ncbi:YihY/virulence factor BrkB family protein [Specibacter sp. NPDC057265]|uniref:YihY/virulence factor BrkB family protein n=1 Tax=Specibacter sp. NPDC057265 TaxID=3346075 RepID=UPI0036322A29
MKTARDTVIGLDGAPGSAARRDGSPEPEDVRKPQNPSDLPAVSWKYVARRAAGKFTADGSTDLAAALTYYSVLSLFPAVLALVSIVGLVGQAEQTTALILDLVGRAAGADTVETLRGPLEQLTQSRAAGWALLLGLGTALWSASAYVGAFSRAMNKIYGVDEGRPVWKLRPALLLVTLSAVLMVATMAVLLVVSGPIAQAIGDVVGLGDATIKAWNIGKWPVVGLLAVVLIAVLYYFTPNVRQPKFRWISLGAGFALLAIVVSSAAFGLYVANFSKYEQTYGAIAGIIVLLLWLWIVNLMLLFGAEVDAELERARELRAGIKAEVQLQLPPRDSTASIKRLGKEQLLVAQGRQLRRQGQEETAQPLGRSAEAHTLWVVTGLGAAAAMVAAISRRRREKAGDTR